MKIIRCTVHRFGTLRDRTFTFDDGLNILCEENGYGKSTLAAFIRAMFYGFPDTRRQNIEENDRKHYLPWGEESAAGSMVFTSGGRTYRVERTFGQRAAADTVALFDEDTGASLPTEGVLGESLFGIDADGFERTAFLSERELAGKNENKSVAAKLSDLSGTDGDLGQVDEAVALIEEERKVLFKKGGRGEIGDLSERITQCTVEITRAEEAETQAERLTGEREAKEAELTSATEALRQAEDAVRKSQMNEAIDNLNAQIAEQKEILTGAQNEYHAARAAFGPEVPTQDDIRDAEKAYRAAEALRSTLKSADAPTAGGAFPFPYVRAEELARMDVYAKKASRPWGGIGLATLFLGLLCGGLAFVLSPLLFIIGGICLVLAVLCLAAAGKAKSEKRALTEFLRAYPVDGMTPTAAIAYIRENQTQAAVFAMQEKERAAERERILAQAEEKERAAMDFCRKHPCACGTDDPFAALDKAFYRLKLSAQTYETAKDRYSLLCGRRDGLDTDESRALTERLSARAAECRETVQTLNRDIEALRHQAKDLSDKAGEKEVWTARRAELESKKEAAEKRLRVLLETKKYLQSAATALTARYLQKTRDAFAAYIENFRETGAAYHMTTSFEMSKETDGATHGIEGYSRGTQNLCNLALRLALVDALYDKEYPPLLLDDPFAYFDDRHLSEGMAVLKKLGNSRQIIYLTCTTARCPKK